MPVTKLQIRPGVVRESTSYANEGGWYYCNKVRFRSGFPEKIGGWVRVLEEQFLGVCTALFPWTLLSGESPLGIGTNLKYYLERGEALYDITPLRKTTNPLVADPFATTTGSSIITVTDNSHGALLGDFVTFSDATGPINNIPASEINAEHQITRIVNANSYEIVVSSTANGNGSGGGAVAIAKYQVHVGLNFYVPGIGWGANPYSSGTWGGSSSLGVNGQIRLWSNSAFGEDLVFCDRNAEIYYWDASIGFGTRAILLVNIGGASDVPVIATAVTVTDSRHVVAFGCNPYDSPPNTTQDPLLIRWSDTESASDWTPTATNSAGGFRLGQGNAIISHKNTRQEILIWTESALYSMQFIGGALVFGFNLLGTNISIIGPNAVVTANNTTYWMGYNKFYMYNGTINTLDCPLRQMVFNNMNLAQGYQVTAGSNEFFTEVTWFYCSTGLKTPDSYVTYNYQENIWYFGTLNRSAWAPAGVRQYPIGADPTNGLLLYHEAAVDDNSLGTPVAINAFIESSDFDLGDGDQFLFIRRMLPDVTFEGSTINNPSVTITLKTRNTAGEDWISSVNEPAVTSTTRTAKSASIFVSPIEQFTPQNWVRLRGRQAIVRIESNAIGVQWQLGALRLDLRPDGRR